MNSKIFYIGERNSTETPGVCTCGTNRDFLHGLIIELGHELGHGSELKEAMTGVVGDREKGKGYKTEKNLITLKSKFMCMQISSSGS